jgi:N-acylglucosamine-6-phosphate 2-epimerase
MHAVLKKMKNKLVVSCQALEEEPLHSSFIMGRMALAAKQGGASGIRANSKEDILEIKSMVDLPVIGIVKRHYPGSDVYITATMTEVDELMEANVDMIAMDATKQKRPKQSLAEMVAAIRNKYPDVALMADVSTLEEAIEADRLGFDCISTTLVGYTAYTAGASASDNDFALLKEMAQSVKAPVIAEGKMNTPALAKGALKAGAHSVVVGGAITRPQQITKTFVEALQ